MSDPKHVPDTPEPIKNPGGDAGSYPMQFVIFLVVFALLVGAYIYFTGGADDSSRRLHTLPRVEHVG